MIERIKRYPLIGLSLAIAAGYVLAHIVVKTGDALYENDPILLTSLVVAALATSAVVWKRKDITVGIHSFWRKTAKMRFPMIYAAGTLLVTGVAWLTGGDPWQVFDIALGLGAAWGCIVLTYRFLREASRRRRNEQWRINFRGDGQV